MRELFRNRAYRHFFVSNVVSLIGNGFVMLAISLLFYDVNPTSAAWMMGLLMSIRMGVNVMIAPFAALLADRIDRRRLLVTLDLIRCAIAVSLPFAHDIWLLFFLFTALQVCTAIFMPTFQTTIAQIVEDDEEYTQALALSRLAYNLETILGPSLAALLFLLLPYQSAFFVTLGGFLISALMIWTVSLPRMLQSASVPAASLGRMLRGVRIFAATPRLRSTFALNFSVSCGIAMVLTNTAVLTRGELGLSDTHVGLTLAAFGTGAILAVLAMPRLLRSVADRQVMLGGGALVAATLLVAGLANANTGLTWNLMLVTWLFLGLGHSMSLTPVGRLLRRSAHPEDQAPLFAAQFSLSHLCGLANYPLAGWLLSHYGVEAAFLALAAWAAVLFLLGAVLWRPRHEEPFRHCHPNLPDDHPHLAGGRRCHAHLLVIDDLHPKWAVTL